MNSDINAGTPVAIASPWRCLLHGILGVMQFEFRRWLLPSRLIFGTALTAIPIALLVISYMQLKTVTDIPVQQTNFGSTIAMFVLVPQMISLLGLLLWATPVINSELEAQTWIYSLSRPMGKVSMLLGKYIVAVAWTTACCFIVASIGGYFTFVSDRMSLWWTIVRLSILANFAYAALFVFIGTILQRRSMVVAFVFTLIFEIGLSNVPAILNRFTVGFRLRSLLFVWEDLHLDNSELTTQYFTDISGVSHHITALAIYVLLLLSASVVRVWWGEYPLQPETA